MNQGWAPREENDRRDEGCEDQRVRITLWLRFRLMVVDGTSAVGDLNESRSTGIEDQGSGIINRDGSGGGTTLCTDPRLR